MDATRLNDILSRGRGLSGSKTGQLCQIYRPNGKLAAIQPNNLIGETYAAFQAEGFGPPKAPDYGQALWWGYFDSTLTQAGDYLVAPGLTYFIARQMPGLPIQCVQTSRVATIARPTASMQGGYSGFFATPGELVLYQWPASILQAISHSLAAQPLENRLGVWTLLLPALPVLPSVGDVVTDDLGSNYTIGATEISTLGCRIAMRQIGP